MGGYLRILLLGVVFFGLAGGSTPSLEGVTLADDGAIPLITDATDEIYPDWSPDGNWVAFESDRSGNYDIWIVPATGGAPIQVTTDTSYDARACWSPSSDEIVFETDRDLSSKLLGAYPVCEIYTVPITGEPATRITYSSGYDERPDWSPDGTTIAFSSDRAAGSLLSSDGHDPLHPSDLFLIPVTGEPATQLTFDPGYENNANWSPDGTMIAFEADYSGNWDIWLIPAAGGTATQLTTDPADDLQPDWSPDGCDIAFYSYRSGNADIWTIPAAGGTATQITTHTRGDWAPSWSPDGTQIVFCSGRGESRDIWIVDVDRAGIVATGTTWGRIKADFR